MFKFKLVGTDGESVDPEWFESSVPSCHAGDEVFIRPGLAYRVLRIEEIDDELQALVVERLVPAQLI